MDVSARPSCEQDLVTTADCKHPDVRPECVGGWCRIPRGCFVAGAPQCEPGRARDSEPQVQVTLTHDFEIQQYETSQAEWVALGLANHSNDADPNIRSCADPGCPVSNVSMQDAARFANKLSESRGLPSCYRFDQCTLEDGGVFMRCAVWEQTVASLYDCQGYRLPTELEWEYAARAGTKSAVYSGDIVPVVSGCDWSESADRIGWYCGNSDRSIRPSGRKAANAWGLYDTSGNVSEWVTTVFDGAGYAKGPLIDPFPKLVPNQQIDISRGGGAGGRLSMMRSASRYMNSPNVHAVGFGFRLVRTLPNR